MSKKYKFLSIGVSLATAVGLLAVYFRHHTIAVLAPKGIIATKERNLMFLTIGIMLIVVIPVFVLTFLIVYRYRDGRNAKYTPDWDHSRKLEAIWWGFPLAVIAVLAVVTWQSSHDLDPARPLISDKQAVVVQVIALQYKWLFIYPEQRIASLNYLSFPAGRPVSFKITSDAPMNSFWIPQLGGQVYAMSGMSMPLQLMSDQPGDFRGVSANISGAGFAGMHFAAHASSEAEFQTWVKNAQKSPRKLTAQTYTALRQPSFNDSVATYAVEKRGLYDAVVLKYLQPWDISYGL